MARNLQNNHVHYLSVLRVSAMAAVVMLHVFATPVTYWHEYYNSGNLFIAVFIKNILISWAVPVFLMISGALFLEPTKEISLPKLYKKYIMRIVIVLFTFGWLFALMEVVFVEKNITVASFITSFVNVCCGKTWSHLWYLYALLGLYIITPILRGGVQNKTVLVYCLIILLIFNCIIPTINTFLGISIGFYIPVNSIYLFYFLVGYGLHKEVVKISPLLSWCFIVLNVLYCILGQFIPDNINFTGAKLSFLDLHSPLAVLMSVGVFSLVKYYSATKMNWFEKLDTLSFGIYIIHALFINILLKAIHINPQHFAVSVVNVVVLTVTVIGSAVSTWMLQKIPFIKKYVL